VVTNVSASLRERRIVIDDVGLSVLELGAASAPPLIMLHGMRDVAVSLLPVAEPLAERYRVVLPDLRGHGSSDRPGCYGMEHYLFDLHRLMYLMGLPCAVMLGHSLGGQILARFAALFPERVRAAVLVEGLGPPMRPDDGDEARELRDRGARLLQTLGISASQRPLPSLDFAAERLLANNPRLPPQRAQALARQATRTDAEGRLTWAFDPRVASVFLNVSLQETERHWRHVTCPTLIVSGDLADEYWRAQLPLEWSGRFALGELEARVALFADAEHVAIAGAGHMVHYDQPTELHRATADFLERRL
jgi:pimeloyl-ACP methyl ester carboxylesterase